MKKTVYRQFFSVVTVLACIFAFFGMSTAHATTTTTATVNNADAVLTLVKAGGNMVINNVTITGTIQNPQPGQTVAFVGRGVNFHVLDNQTITTEINGTTKAIGTLKATDYTNDWNPQNIDLQSDSLTQAQIDSIILKGTSSNLTLTLGNAVQGLSTINFKIEGNGLSSGVKTALRAYTLDQAILFRTTNNSSRPLGPNSQLRVPIEPYVRANQVYQAGGFGGAPYGINIDAAGNASGAIIGYMNSTTAMPIAAGDLITYELNPDSSILFDPASPKLQPGTLVDGNGNDAYTTDSQRNIHDALVLYGKRIQLKVVSATSTKVVYEVVRPYTGNRDRDTVVIPVRLMKDDVRDTTHPNGTLNFTDGYVYNFKPTKATITRKADGQEYPNIITTDKISLSSVKIGSDGTINVPKSSVIARYVDEDGNAIAPETKIADQVTFNTAYDINSYFSTNFADTVETREGSNLVYRTFPDYGFIRADSEDEVTGNTKENADTIVTYIYRKAVNDTPDNPPTIDNDNKPMLKIDTYKDEDDNTLSEPHTPQGQINIDGYKFISKTEREDGTDYVYRKIVNKVPNEAPTTDKPMLKIDTYKDEDDNTLSEPHTPQGQITIDGYEFVSKSERKDGTDYVYRKVVEPTPAPTPTPEPAPAPTADKPNTPAPAPAPVLAKSQELAKTGSTVANIMATAIAIAALSGAIFAVKRKLVQ